MARESDNNPWQNPEVHSKYKEWRADVAGLFEEQVIQACLPYIPSGGRVLEVGAGAGILFDAVKDDLPDGVRWLETDQTGGYLHLPRETPRGQMVVTLPEVPLADSQIDVVVGLSTLDVIPPGVLRKSIKEFSRILKSGGHVVHMLDLGTNPDYMMREAESEGYMAIPGAIHSAGDEIEGLGLHLVSKRKIRGMMYVMDLPDSVKAVISQMLNNPESTLYVLGTEYERVLDLLAIKMRESGLVERTIDLWEDFSKNAVSAAKEAGLMVKEAGVREAQKDISSGELQPWLPEDTAMIEKRFGVKRITDRKEFPHQHLGVVTVRSNLLVHTFQKPSESEFENVA
jgi:ubiquinone/menaquinone biosynthesis C-methylase UbiE